MGLVSQPSFLGRGCSIIHCPFSDGGVPGEFLIMLPLVSETIPDNVIATPHCWLPLSYQSKRQFLTSLTLRGTHPCHSYKWGKENATRNSYFDYLFLEKLVGIAREGFEPSTFGL